MNSGNRTNCAPSAAAFSAYMVACFRFPSMSWSSDFIWTTAIRKVLATDFVVFTRSEACPFNGISTDPDPPSNKRANMYRKIFMWAPPFPKCPVLSHQTSALTERFLNIERSYNTYRQPYTPGFLIVTFFFYYSQTPSWSICAGN